MPRVLEQGQIIYRELERTTENYTSSEQQHLVEIEHLTMGHLVSDHVARISHRD